MSQRSLGSAASNGPTWWPTSAGASRTAWETWSGGSCPTQCSPGHPWGLESPGLVHSSNAKPQLTPLIHTLLPLTCSRRGRPGVSSGPLVVAQCRGGRGMSLLERVEAARQGAGKPGSVLPPGSVVPRDPVVAPGAGAPETSTPPTPGFGPSSQPAQPRRLGAREEAFRELRARIGDELVDALSWRIDLSKPAQVRSELAAMVDDFITGYLEEHEVNLTSDERHASSTVSSTRSPASAPSSPPGLTPRSPRSWSTAPIASTSSGLDASRRPPSPSATTSTCSTSSTASSRPWVGTSTRPIRVSTPACRTDRVSTPSSSRSR